MYPSIKELHDILVKQDYISEADSESAQAASTDSQGYIDFLIHNELLSKALLGQAIAESHHLPFADLGANPPGKEQAGKIPENEARTLRIVVAKAEGDGV